MESVQVKNEVNKGAHVSVDLEVGSADMEPFFRDIVNKLSKQVKIKGFRPGKAPSKLIEQKYGKKADEIFLEDFLSRVLNWYNTENQFQILENPKVSLKEYIRKEKLMFSAEYDILPIVTLPNYKKCSIKEDTINIQADDILDELKLIQKRNAQLKIHEGKSELGNEITLMVTVKDEDGKILEENKVIKTILGENKQLPELDQGIKNIAKDETREIKIKYPEDFQELHLRGKIRSFKCIAKEINEIILPEMDDELAKDEGFANLEELNKNIETQLENFGNNVLQKKAKVVLIEKLTDQTKTDIPGSICDIKIQSLVNDLVKTSNLKAKNIEELEKEIGSKEGKKTIQDIKLQAAFETKKLLMLTEIANVEKISVTDEELDRQVEAFSVQFGIGKDELMDRFKNNNRLNSISQDLLIQKTIDFIYQQSDKKKGKSIKLSELS